MKSHKLLNLCTALLLSACLILSLASCGGGAKATSMHLKRTEGTVAVSDGDGKDVPVLDNLGLYSGYGTSTNAESYAWIDLDNVKLTKMDQESEITIQQDGKALEIEVKSGSLFFNITEPLEDDETLNIRTSTLLVGIRGTCGWVEDNGGLSRVYLLEGKVECSAEEQTVQVSAGEMAELTADRELVVEQFTTQDLPAFVRDEVVDDDDLSADILEASGLDIQNADDEQSWQGESVTVSGEFEIDVTGDTVTWSLSGGTLTVNGTGVVRAPEFVEVGQIDRTSSPWYGYREQIRTLVIGNGITEIGTCAFCDCINLTSVSIPNSVTRIANSPFNGCSSLTSITIPDSVTEISFTAFGRCSSLARITIPASVTNIAESAFNYCDNLKDIYYSGNEAQWNQITIMSATGVDNNPLFSATIHYNSTGN